MGWILYDFANSSYHLMIPTIIMPLFFRQYLLAGTKHIDFSWGLLVSLPVFLAGIIGPIIGAYADIANRRQTVLFCTAAIAIASIIVVPLGGREYLPISIAAFVVSYLFFTLSLGIYDSFLPLIIEKNRVGTISGLGWGIGYLGGLLALGTTYPLISRAILPDDLELFKYSVWITGFLYAIFSLTSYLFLKRSSEKSQPGSRGIAAVKIALKRVKGTIKNWRRNRSLLLALISYYLANDGLATLVYFTSIYAATTLGFDNQQILTLFLVVQIIGIPSSIVGGMLADRFGHKKVIYLVLGLWGVLCFLFAIAKGMTIFILLSCGTGLVIGTTPAVYRSLLALYISSDQAAELYGFNSFATRASSILGPLLFGLVASLTGNQRVAMLFLLIFFGLAAFVLRLIEFPLVSNKILALERQP